MNEFELPKKVGKGVIGFVVFFVLVIIISKSIVIIPPGTAGVVVMFGKVRPVVLASGLHVINPLARVFKMSVRTEEYTMSAAAGEGRIRGDDSIEALTKEGLTVKLDLTAWYRLMEDKAPNVYRTIGLRYEAKIVRPALKTAIRSAVVKYTAADIYTKKRAQVVSDIESSIKVLMEGRGIIIEKILLRNVILPKRLMDAIGMKLAAEQEAQKMEFVLMKEEKEKERKIIEAAGVKKSNQIIAAGLTERYLRWYRIDMMKQLINSPNNTVIFIPQDMKTSPIINIPANR